MEGEETFVTPMQGQNTKMYFEKKKLIYYTCIARPSHSIRVASGLLNNSSGFAEAIPWAKVN